MTISPKYKEKELTIMHALMELLSSGMSLHEIKTSDIAQAAGIGKGTLYNYFATKEDIIAQTILYNVQTELDEIFRRMNEETGFREKCYCIMQCVHEIISNESSDFHLILFNVGGREMQQFFQGDMSFVREYLAMIFEKTVQLAQLGAEEGLLLRQEDEEYAYSACAAALMSFIHARCRLDEPTEKGILYAMDNAYKILIKALN